MKIVLSIFILSLFTAQITIAQDTTGLAISKQRFQKQMKKKKKVVIYFRTHQEYKAVFI